MASYESNTLVLVNVADGKDSSSDYKVHIRYTNDTENGPLLEKPPAKYIGFYVGPEEKAPEEINQYQWSSYDNEITYIDIRYSNDNGATLTFDSKLNKANGKISGVYMGVLITKNSIVIKEDWYPESEEDSKIKLSDYTWSKINNNDFNNLFLETNCNSIFKFLTEEMVNEERIQKYVYLPEKLSVKIKKNTEKGVDIENFVHMIITGYYYNENSELLEQPLKDEDRGETEISLNDFKKNFETITIEVYNRDNYPNKENNFEDILPILAQTFNITYGSSKDMATLSLNATDIVASIQEAGLRFSSEGLSITNGNLQILNEEGQVFFETSRDGEGFFSGTLKASKGEIGGWIIGEDGLHSDNKLVGLYSQNNYYPKCNNSEIDQEDFNNLVGPIRFWSGKKITETDHSFIVTENGYLFANKAEIEGTIVATNGYIKNDFFIGEKNSGIIISGRENGKSYIGSSNYNSGAFGYGWKLNENGDAEFTNISARGKITSSVFEYNRISSIGGNLYIAPTIYFNDKSNIIQKSEGQIEEWSEEEKDEYYVTWTLLNHNSSDIGGHEWESNEIVKLDGLINNGISTITLSGLDGIISKIDIKDEKVEITVKFNYETESKIEGSYSFEPGAFIVLHGTNNLRQGIYLSAADFGGPFIEVYNNSSLENIIIPAVRLGNLSGITDVQNFGGALSGYGLYSSNAYLQGELVLPQAGVTNQKNLCYIGDQKYQLRTDLENDDSLIRIWAGAKYPKINSEQVAPFIVTQDGTLYASKGVFSGVVKAVDSEFSGVIKAAGVVVDNPNTSEIIEAKHNHFFVAYKEIPTSFEDYILDINSEGISIWKGGLKAYSDKSKDEIYGYNKDSNPNPMPYFYFIDEDQKSRFVSYKGHFLDIKKTENKEQLISSIIIDNGIWFGENLYTKDISTDQIEEQAYQKFSKKTGLFLDNNILTINGGDKIKFSEGNNIYFNYSKDEIEESKKATVNVKGELNISKKGDYGGLSLGTSFIKEVTEITDGTIKTIGVDIIVS